MEKNTKTKVVAFIGTRPEAIKMLPIIVLAQKNPEIDFTLVCTGQHRELTIDFLHLFGIKPDIDFEVMRPGQNLAYLTGRILKCSTDYLMKNRPDLVLVHGDTTTAFAVALAAFYEKVPIGHVEAGLRTNDMDSPFPEEMNRFFIDNISRWCFAPTLGNYETLEKEGVNPDKILIVGNTIIDAVIFASKKIEKTDWSPGWIKKLESHHRTNLRLGNFTLVTCHRRENHSKMADITDAILDISQKYPDESILLPVHPNPMVKAAISNKLGSTSNILLLEPQNYLEMVWLMQRSKIILTDSGGIQEEAPALGTPCVVMRDSTERPEAIASGWALMAGTSRSSINKTYEKARQLNLENLGHNPFGDGRASERILAKLSEEARGESAISRLTPAGQWFITPPLN